MRNPVDLALVGIVLWAGAPFLAAANNPNPNPEPDRIAIMSRLPLSGRPVVQLTLGSHWQRNYLYISRGGAEPVAVLDVTDAASPKEAGQLDLPRQKADGTISAVVGTAALIASPAPPPLTQTVTILSFADPEHPTIVREFEGVTAMINDPSRGLVYLADAKGIWVLHLEPATDEPLEEQYRQYILYNR